MEKNVQRIYPRFKIRNELFASLYAGDKKIGVIVDLSFGGFSVQVLAEFKEKPWPVGMHQISIRFVDEVISCRAELLYQKEGFWGFRFTHETTLVLRFFKPCLYWMRMGVVQSYVEKYQVVDSSELPVELQIEGQIPIEIEVTNRGQGGEFDFVLTFQEERVLYQVRMIRGNLQTMHNVSEGGRAEDLRPTLYLDDYVMRIMVCFILGYLESDFENQWGKKITAIMQEWQRSKRSRTISVSGQPKEMSL